MKYILFSFLTLMQFVGFAQSKFVVDENATVRTITGSFTAVHVSSSIHLFITKGEEETVAVSANTEEIKGNIKTEIEDGVLKIYYKGNNYRSSFNKQMNVYVSYKILQEIKASDASSVLIADKLSATSLNIKVNDASVVKGEIESETLTLKLSDASVVTLSGVAKNTSIRCSDASIFNGFKLDTESADCVASDASIINALASKTINASASDASIINYKGTAEIKQKSSRDGSIINRKD